MSFKDNKDFQNMIVKSIAVSYLLTSVFDMLVAKYKISFGEGYHKVIIYFVCSALLGFVIGKFTSHRWFNYLLHKLHIGRTTNENIWDDVIKPGTWVRVFMSDESSYLGLYRYGEPFKSAPIIVLTNYQKFDSETDIVIDNSNEPNRMIMLNTKDFEKIEIIYTEDYKWEKFKAWFKKQRQIFRREWN